MSIKALADYTQYSRYARYDKEKKRRETWHEQVDRVFEMHERKFGEKLDAIRDDFEFTKEMVKKKRILGSQRALQFGGDSILQKPAKLYNCTVSYVDRPRFFQECMYLLLCGCGTGFSVQTHHVEKLPKVAPRDKGKKTFLIPDTIEGWSDAIGVLMDSYFVSKTPYYSYDYQSEENYSGYEIEFDFSIIRPAGAAISWGGKAPGPDGLKNSIAKITELLDKVVSERGKTNLKPIEAYDIVMHSSDAVLSGGIRRSATICLFSPHDEEMVNAKTGSWFIDNPQRGRSNNSALLIRNKTTAEEFSKLMESVKQFGEPGFVWADDTEALYNPCFHGDTRLLTNNGWYTIKELYENKQENIIYVDKRVGKGDFLNLKTDEKSELMSATKVEITQRNARVYNVETEHGFSLKITDNHEIPTLNGRKKLKDINVGETILIQKDKGIFGKQGDYTDGFLLGMVMGDGTFTENEAFVDIWEDDFELLDDISQKINEKVSNVPILNGQKYDDLQWMDQTSETPKKRMGGIRFYRYFKEILGIESPQSIKENLPEIVWKGSEEFLNGFLSSIIITDGSVQSSGHKLKNTISVRINQSNKKLLQEIQIILASFGIISKIYSRREEGERLLPDGKGDYKLYHCKENFELIINRPNSLVLLNESCLIGRKKELLHDYLDKRGYNCKKPEHFITKIKSIEYDSTQEKVYCLKQDFNNTVIANGLIVGQCVEIGMRAYTEDGRSGWQFCNLCEINGRKATSEEAFLEQCRAAAILGTLQAAYDEFNYLTSETSEIVKREALLGVSMTGMMDNPHITFDQEIQKKGAKLILEINERISQVIGINKCARATCVKPAGSTSCILGSASGVHPHHAKRYMRRVQANKLEFPVQHFMTHNPSAVQESVWSNNKTDLVITFLCEVPDGAKTKNQVNAVDLLEHVRLTQQNWVEYGTRHESCVAPWLRHNVSNTINVKDDEWDDVEKFIYENRKWFAGISLLSHSGDMDYPQAPFASVLNEKEIVQQYGEGSVLASGLVVDALKAFDNNLWAACDCALGIGEKLDESAPIIEEPCMPHKNGYTNKQWTEKLAEYASDLASYHDRKEIFDKNELKKDWVRRFKQFAERYSGGNYRKCTHMLKHVSLWKEWLDLKRSYIDIDWSQVEEEDYVVDVTELAGAACSGPNGTCETGALGESINAKKQELKESARA